MHIFLWVLQVFLALHTLMGAVWKFSNSSQNIASLKAIPHAAWLGLSAVEILLAIGLVLPALARSLGVLAPIAALGVAAEMLLFVALHLVSKHPEHGQMIYWLVVAAVCGFLAFGRFVLEPL